MRYRLMVYIVVRRGEMNACRQWWVVNDLVKGCLPIVALMVLGEATADARWGCTGGHCSCCRWSNGNGPATIIIVNAWCGGVVVWVIDARSGNPQ